MRGRVYTRAVAVQNRIVKIQKRNRALVTFDVTRICKALQRAADSIGFTYFLKLAGDSLTAMADSPGVSRLFGKIDEKRGLFSLIGLGTVSPAFVDGIPVLTGGGNTLSGRLVLNMEIAGRQVSRPALFLDGRAIDSGKLGQGSLYTPEGGLERTWRFGGRTGSVAGWDRR